MKCTTHISFKCDEEMKLKLEEIAEHERRSVSNIIKIALEERIKRYEREKENAAEHK